MYWAHLPGGKYWESFCNVYQAVGFFLVMHQRGVQLITLFVCRFIAAVGVGGASMVTPLYILRTHHELFGAA